MSIAFSQVDAVEPVLPVVPGVSVPTGTAAVPEPAQRAVPRLRAARRPDAVVEVTSTSDRRGCRARRGTPTARRASTPSAKVTCPPVDTIAAGSHGQLYAVAGAEPHAGGVVVPATHARRARSDSRSMRRATLITIDRPFERCTVTSEKNGLLEHEIGATPASRGTCRSRPTRTTTTSRRGRRCRVAVRRRRVQLGDDAPDDILRAPWRARVVVLPRDAERGLVAGPVVRLLAAGVEVREERDRARPTTLALPPIASNSPRRSCGTLHVYWIELPSSQPSWPIPGAGEPGTPGPAGSGRRPSRAAS